MLASFTIVLREGLEIALILAILIGYVDRVGRHELRRPIWIGTGISLAVCLALGAVLQAVLNGVDESTMALLEGITMLAACAVLTWMIIWMRTHARTLKTTMEARMAGIATGTAMGVFAATAVAREGIETTLFLLAAAAQGTAPAALATGATVGTVAAIVLGTLIVTQSRRLDLQRWFTLTGVALVLFAGNSLGYGLHELREWAGMSGIWDVRVWDIESGIFASGPLYDLLAMFGWSSHPEWFRVLAYGTYVFVMLRWLFSAPAPATRPVSAPVSASATPPPVASEPHHIALPTHGIRPERRETPRPLSGSTHGR